MNAWRTGQHIAWDIPHSGPAVVRITGVSPYRITYVSSDGVGAAVEATIFRTLEQNAADWRPATEAEAAAFEARYRPAPQNWH